MTDTLDTQLAYANHQCRDELIVNSYTAALTEKEFISGEAMLAWVESWDTSVELPSPKPDVFRYLK